MILPCQQHLDMGERSNFIDLPMALAARTKIRDWGVANIAQALTQIVDPAAEIGASLKLGALVRRPPGHDPNAAAKRAALEAFRAQIGYIVSDAREDRTLTAAADRVGIIGVGTELGGAGTVTLETLAVARRGLQNMLWHLA